MKKRMMTLLVAVLVLLTALTLPITSQHTMAATKTAKVTASSLHVRELPKTTAKSLGLLKKGKEVSVTSQQSGWAKIKSGSLTGWVSAAYLDEIGYVTASSLVLRGSNSTAAKALASLKKRTSVEIKAKKGSWLNVYVPSQKKTGWVSKSYISSAKPSSGTVKTEAVKYYVTANSLHLRKSASTASASLSVLKKGEAVTYLKKSGNWANIKISSGVNGWASLTYLSLNKPDEKANDEKGTTYYVTADELTVRKSGNAQADKITSVKTGEAVTLYENKSNWGRIKTASGKTGWVSMTYLSKTKPKAEPAKDSTPKAEPVKFTPISYYVTANSLNIRTGPSASYKVLGAVLNGDSVTVTEQKNGWGKVTSSSGLSGWASLAYLSKTKPEAGLKGKVIVVDAGHGGTDPGAVGRSSKEKDLTLASAKKLRDKLTAAGAKVIMTRSGDTYPTLKERVAISNANKADVFISIHYNVGPSSANGIETYYYATNVNEQELAKTVQSEIIKETDLKDRGAKPGNFQVIRDNKQAAILIELGFISNEAEEKLIATNEYQEAAITGIYNGLEKYFSR